MSFTEKLYADLILQIKINRGFLSPSVNVLFKACGNCLRPTLSVGKYPLQVQLKRKDLSLARASVPCGVRRTQTWQCFGAFCVSFLGYFDFFLVSNHIHLSNVVGALCRGVGNRAGQTLRPFPTPLSLRGNFLLWLDDDVNGPLSASFLMLGVCGDRAPILTHLLLRGRPDGPQTLGGSHL